MKLSEVDKLSLKCSILNSKLIDTQLKQLEVIFQKAVDEYNQLYIGLCEKHGHKPGEVEFNYETGEIKVIKTEVKDAKRKT